MTYLTNFHAIEEYLKSGKSSCVLLVAKAGPRAQQIISQAVALRIRLERTGVASLDRLAPGHRGIALQIEDKSLLDTTDLAGFLESLGSRRSALVVILDEITDPHNYGAILRSCDQFGVDIVVSRTRRSARNTDIVTATSAGVSAWVPVAEVPNLPRAVQDLKEAGFWIYGADMSGTPVYQSDLSGRVALILGSEGSGISRLLREQCDTLIAIPSKGKIDSLNVSVAAGVLLYEILRQNDTIKPPHNFAVSK
ncbi:MAG: 23S rRNA (guanosine(2251)-2'-O)-methyltransferase RlmB [Spirochaetaceae bacterium]|jgi:23S rRNA (guanosine2251-2'-O)-methyltransferase|nr:23S rRNA (guanosine(2251)-2'-O)-methyltransferase RlmB [Spirochaetaceae bacterium]